MVKSGLKVSDKKGSQVDAKLLLKSQHSKVESSLELPPTSISLNTHCRVGLMKLEDRTRLVHSIHFNFSCSCAECVKVASGCANKSACF